MAKMMTSFAFSCLCHHRGVSGYAGTPSFPAVEAHTEHRVLVRRDGGPIVPPPPDPGDLAGKYGVQAPAKDFEATLLGPNPTPGDSDQVMLSKDRSPRSESICLVEHPVLVRRDSGPIVPPPPDPGDLVGKYGVQAPAKDFEATLLGPNPTPGDSDQVMLSKDRSPRSESICLVEHPVLVRRDGGPIVPPPPDPGDLVGKYGVQAPAKDFEATLLGPNPTPGDSDQVMLSKGRSPRSESICLVERSSSCDTGSNARLAMKGSVQQSSVNRPEDSEHVPVIPGPGPGLMTGTGTRYPVSGTQFHRPLLVNRVL